MDQWQVNPQSGEWYYVDPYTGQQVTHAQWAQKYGGGSAGGATSATGPNPFAPQPAPPGQQANYFGPQNSMQQMYYTTSPGQQDAWIGATQREIGTGNGETPYAKWLRSRYSQSQVDYHNRALAKGQQGLDYQYTDYVNEALPGLRDEYDLYSAKQKGTDQRYAPAGRRV